MAAVTSSTSSSSPSIRSEMTLVPEENNMTIKPLVIKVKGLRKNKENRKIPKPLIERKRRARINTSLQELESLLGELNGKVKVRKNGKVEKADILEVTVLKMKELDLKKRDTSTHFVNGFETCLNEVKLFFDNNDVPFGNEILAVLNDRLRQQLYSLGFCSVIRHTNELQNNGISSSTTSHDQQLHSTLSSPTTRVVQQEADSAESLVWRPWFGHSLVTN